MVRKRVPVTERFWRFVTSGPPDQCWLWRGAIDPQTGYGRINSGGAHGKALEAHRVSWEIHHGPIPSGMMVCHSCDNRPCVNPAHHFLGDALRNNTDMDAKGRRKNGPSPGEKNGSAKLTEDQVREIRRRRANGEKGVTLATEFGVQGSTISWIITGKHWKNIADEVRA